MRKDIYDSLAIIGGCAFPVSIILLLVAVLCGSLGLFGIALTVLIGSVFLTTLEG